MHDVIVCCAGPPLGSSEEEATQQICAKDHPHHHLDLARIHDLSGIQIL